MNKVILVFKTTLLLVGLFFCNSAHSQVNLVPNPSFEHLTTCNFFAPNFQVAFPWDSLITRGGGGVALFNTCSIFDDGTPPTTYVGYQYPRTGNGMVGFDLSWDFWHQPGLRNYAQVPLIQTLQSGTVYTVTFYVSRCAGSKYGIDRIGAYLDNGIIATTYGNLVSGVTPQIENPQHQIIADTVNWTKIQGCFTANGIESYLTLGNFYPDSLMDSLTLPYNMGYGLTGTSSYFFDDVSLLETSTVIKANNDTTITAGDTVLLGATIEGFPVEWFYLNGTLLAASSQVKVTPTVTTKYVVKMDLCGFVSYDTITVRVWGVGVEEVKSEKLKVYPNPCSESLVISQLSLGYKIHIYDLMGRSLSLTISKGEEIATLDTSPLAAGVYFIKVIDKNGTVKCGKFVKE